ncbi:MAG TPA: hypothetical protein VF170_18940 [Planctomycetaceae bacterium]
MSPFFRRLAHAPVVADGTAAVVVRLALVAAAVYILMAGFFHLPETTTTRGELVIGVILALIVAAQMLVAALFRPMNGRRT